MKKTKKVLLELKNIGYDIYNLTGNKITILNDFNLKIYNKKILGIVGKSGCGKSTLLKIISGLVSPSRGAIKYHTPEPPKITMVFEDFALFPWLNVEENIALGMKSEYASEAESTMRVKEIISLIDLEGYEDYYPKELSLGMKQRVSFARALISEPDILLLDAPFASLDAFSAETLANDLVDLWQQNMIKTKSIILVSHKVNDIVNICSDIAIIRGRPSKIVSQFPVDMPMPRIESSSEYQDILNRIYQDLEVRLSSTDNIYKKYINIIGVDAPALIGMLEMLGSKEYRGEAEISEFSNAFDSETNILLPILELAKILRFIKFSEESIKMTPFGRALIQVNNPKKRKMILQNHLIKHIDVIRNIYDAGKEKIPVLQEKMIKYVTQQEAEEIMDTLVSLAQYAEVI